MTFRNISRTLMNAAFLLFVVGLSGKAAAEDCGARHHATATECRAHHPRVADQSRTQKFVQTTIDSGEVAPAVASHAAGPSSWVADLAGSASTVAHRFGQASAGPSPWRGHGAPAGNRWPTADNAPPTHNAVTGVAGIAQNDNSLADLLRGKVDGLPAVPAPIAWTVLLAGLLGLRALFRTPGVAKAQSWATAARFGSRAKARGWAVDRVDPERYALAQVRRSPQGRFVRASAEGRFGA